MLNDKQCRSRSVGFFRSQLIWICTVCKERAYPGSAGLGLKTGYWATIYSTMLKINKKNKRPTAKCHKFPKAWYCRNRTSIVKNEATRYHVEEGILQTCSVNSLMNKFKESNPKFYNSLLAVTAVDDKCYTTRRKHIAKSQEKCTISNKSILSV